MTTDSLRFEHISDSLSTLYTEYNSVSEDLDSALQTISKLQEKLSTHTVSESYFQSIINTQGVWFIILITLIAILSGLGVWKLFAMKLNEIRRQHESVIKDLKKDHEDKNNAINLKLKEHKTERKAEIKETTERLEKELKTLIDVTEERLDTSINQGTKDLKGDFDVLREKVSLNIEQIKNHTSSINAFDKQIGISIDTAKEELITTINEQQEAFEHEKEELIDKVNEVTYDTHRANFFANLNKKSYYPALTWAIPILEMVLPGTSETQIEFDDWIHNTSICVDELTESNVDDFERLKNLIKALEKIQSQAKNENSLKEIDKLLATMNLLYWDHMKKKKEDETNDSE